MTTTPASATQPAGTVDPRAPRFGAAITSALLLAGVYLAAIGSSTGPGLAQLPLEVRAADPGFLVLLLVALLFAWSLISARTHPFAALFRGIVRPRLGPPTEWEDARPPRFAQGVGLFVVGIGLDTLRTDPDAVFAAAMALSIAKTMPSDISSYFGSRISSS